MASKLTAARMASWSGIRSVIARAVEAGGARRCGVGRTVGTTFEPHDRTLPARKLWIAFAAEVVGTIEVDAGAERALIDARQSAACRGDRGAGPVRVGDTVNLAGPSGRLRSRHGCRRRPRRCRTMLGRRTTDLPAGIAHEVVHRDDLVVLPA